MEEQRLTLRDKSTALSSQYNEAQDKLLHASEELEKSEGKRQVLNERKKNASQNKEQLERALKDKAAQLAQTNEEWRLEKTREEEASSCLKELEDIVAKKQQLIERASSNTEEEIDRFKADYIEVLNEQASIRNERRYLEEQYRQQQVKQERLLAENAGLLAGREEVVEQLENAKQEAA